MILLANEYSLRGRKDWRYKILKREGDIVIAEMHSVDDMETPEGPMTEASLRGYEVFVVQKYPERPRPDGKGMIPAKEMPPPDYHWGRYGHSYSGVGMKDGSCLKRAQEKFAEELIAQEKRIANREGKVVTHEQQVENDMLVAANDRDKSPNMEAQWDKLEKKVADEIKSVKSQTKKKTDAKHPTTTLPKEKKKTAAGKKSK